MKKFIAIFIACALLGLESPASAMGLLFWKHKKHKKDDKHKKVEREPTAREDVQMRKDKEHLRETGHTDFSTLTKKQQKQITKHHMYPMKKKDMDAIMVRTVPVAESKKKDNKADATPPAQAATLPENK